MHFVFLVKSTGKERGMSPGPPANRVWHVFSYFSTVISKARLYTGVLSTVSAGGKLDFKGGQNVLN